MPRAQKKNTKGWFFDRPLSSNRVQVFVATLLFGAVGAYLVFWAGAVGKHTNNCIGNNYCVTPDNYCEPTTGSCIPAVPNPSLLANCKQGLDIALLIDGSGSMAGSEGARAKTAAKALITAMQGHPTYFTVGLIDATDSDNGNRARIQPPFTQDTQELHRLIDSIEFTSESSIEKLERIAAVDKRSDRQNFIIILSDFLTDLDAPSISQTKQAGTRILSLLYESNSADFARGKIFAQYVSGKNLDTGSAITSDVMTVNQDKIGEELTRIGVQLCNTSVGTGSGGPGHGHGDGGTGTGTNGRGQGVGPGPGAAGGGGGSSATHQGEADNTTPSSSSQGENKEQPKVEPSPFFDGKLFGIGSDSDPNVQKDRSISVGGVRIGYGWFYLVGLLVLLGIIGFVGWVYRKQLGKTFGSFRRRIHI